MKWLFFWGWWGLLIGGLANDDIWVGGVLMGGLENDVINVLCTSLPDSGYVDNELKILSI